MDFFNVCTMQAFPLSCLCKFPISLIYGLEHFYNTWYSSICFRCGLGSSACLFMRSDLCACFHVSMSLALSPRKNNIWIMNSAGETSNRYICGRARCSSLRAQTELCKNMHSQYNILSAIYYFSEKWFTSTVVRRWSNGCCFSTTFVEPFSSSLFHLIHFLFHSLPV